MNYSKSELIRLYKKETNLKVKERMLLVIKVEHDNVIPAYAADELHRSRPWALYWLDRFSAEGIDGLKNRPKSGRPPDIPREVVYEIKNELSSSKQGWTTKQVEDLIVRKRVVESDTIIPTFTDSCTSGDSNRRRYQEKYM